LTGEEIFSGFLAANEEAQVAMGVQVDSPWPWKGSPFEWMMRLASRRRGKAGELLAAAWMRTLGYRVEPPLSGDHDRLVNGRKVEIKMSTLWEGGTYVFQQLRDQDYECAFLLGISPTIAHAWLLPKSVAFARSVPQHGGARGSDTRWLSFAASAPPDWLDEYGGSLSECVAVLASVLEKP